jgi:hypothetical protein
MNFGGWKYMGFHWIILCSGQFDYSSSHLDKLADIHAGRLNSKMTRQLCVINVSLPTISLTQLRWNGD